MNTIVTAWAWAAVAVGVLAGIAFFLSPLYLAAQLVLGWIL